MSQNAFFKQPDEVETISMDYTRRLNSTETISSLSVTAATIAGVDATSTLIASSSISGVYCYAKIQAGTNNTKYKITFKATTSEGNIYEEDVLLTVLSI
jgi:hypothetical protein